MNLKEWENPVDTRTMEHSANAACKFDDRLTGLESRVEGLFGRTTRLETLRSVSSAAVELWAAADLDGKLRALAEKVAKLEERMNNRAFVAAANEAIESNLRGEKTRYRAWSDGRQHSKTTCPRCRCGLDITEDFT